MTKQGKEARKAERAVVTMPRSPAIRRAKESARRLGYSVRFVDYCEDADTPGFLGQYGGVCDRKNKVIKVRTKGMTRTQIAAIIEHEIEHANGAEHATDHPELGLRCGGNFNPFA